MCYATQTLAWPLEPFHNPEGGARSQNIGEICSQLSGQNSPAILKLKGKRRGECLLLLAWAMLWQCDSKVGGYVTRAWRQMRLFHGLNHTTMLSMYIRCEQGSPKRDRAWQAPGPPTNSGKRPGRRMVVDQCWKRIVIRSSIDSVASRNAHGSELDWQAFHPWPVSIYNDIGSVTIEHGYGIDNTNWA